MGSIWFSDTYADITSAVWGNYFDASNNPKDNANGADVWLNWSDYADHGTAGVTVTNHSTSLEDY